MLHAGNVFEKTCEVRRTAELDTSTAAAHIDGWCWVFGVVWFWLWMTFGSGWVMEVQVQTTIGVTQGYTHANE